jgi:hypothetical protein
VKDCEWISDLARHGLIAKSFVPPRPIRELREPTRYRRKLAQVQAAERNRLIKLLESATSTAAQYRAARTQAFQTWAEITGVAAAA